MKSMSKKGSGVLDNLAALGVSVAGLAIVLVVTFLIISTGRTQTASIEGINMGNATQMASSHAMNATGALTSAVAGIPAWVPLIIIAFVGTILIGMVAMFKGRK